MLNGLMPIQSRRVVPAGSAYHGHESRHWRGCWRFGWTRFWTLVQRRKMLDVIAEIALLKFCFWWQHVGVVAVGLQGLFARWLHVELHTAGQFDNKR